MSRRKKLLLGVGILVLIPLLGIGWWLLSPLLLNQTVEEGFPLSSSATVPPGMTRAEVEKTMADMASKDQEVVEAMPPVMGMAPAGPKPGDGMLGTLPPAGGGLATPVPVMPVTAMPVTAAPAAGPAQVSPPAPQRLKAGEFRDADSFHKGSGQAVIYRTPDRGHLLRLENLRVTNGPDLHVLLTPGADIKSREDLRAAGYTDLGSLKGNIGNQNYPIPAGVEVASQGSVVIYCLPFQVVFSVAALKR
jgi:hypothetical protein